MTKTELEQQQHNAICATLDIFKKYGYIQIFQHPPDEVWDALSGLEAAARAGGADYNDI